MRRYGPFASRPVGPLPAGFQYQATDHQTTYLWNGAAWIVMDSDARYVDFRLHDWTPFEEIYATLPGDSNHQLTVSNGVGTIAGGLPSAGGNDRAYYLLTGQYADVEAALEFELSTVSAQCGIVLRSQAVGGVNSERVGVVAWSNVVFGASGNILHGVWRSDGDNTLTTDQQPTSLEFRRPMLDATGDGTTVIVKTAVPHNVGDGELVSIAGTGLWDDNQTVTAVPDALTFEFSHATVGGPTTGTYDHVQVAARRRLAVSLTGDLLRSKQWWPDMEPEPSWHDSTRARSLTLPATLAGGEPLPTSGQVGFLAAHLADTRSVTIYDMKIDTL